jgi:hypothetical protein
MAAQIHNFQILSHLFYFSFQSLRSTLCSAEHSLGIIAVIRRFQNRVLKNTVGAPWYVRNADLYRDLRIEMLTAEVRRFARKHEERLLHHDNVEAIQLLDNSELIRRLRRTKPFELV